MSQSQEPITCQSPFTLLTISLRVQACHIGRVRGLSFRAYPVRVSVDSEAPGEWSTSSYTLQERLHRFVAFVVSEKKTTLTIDLIF